MLPLDCELKKQYKNISKNEITSFFKLDNSIFFTKFFNWIFVCFIAILAFSIENMVRNTLLSIRMNTQNLGFKSDTRQSLKVEVDGEGLAGDMVRNLLSGFEFDHRFTASGHMKDCLPKLHKMEDDMIFDVKKLSRTTQQLVC